MLRLLLLASVCVSVAIAGCSNGYTENNGNCYKVYLSSQTYASAESVCKSDEGNLASIHDIYTDTALASLIPNSQSAWIGLTCSTATTCTWSDGTPYDFNEFKGGVPVVAYGQCVTMSQTDASWYSSSCGALQNSFICKMRAANINSTQPTLAPPTCPSIQMFNDNGTIYSPGFPVSFPADTKCQYLLAGPTGSNISIHFPRFDTDSGTTLEIYDGITTTSPMITLSGQPDPIYTYHVTRNVMKLVFETSKKPVGQGWEAEFTSTGFSVPSTTTIRPSTPTPLFCNTTGPTPTYHPITRPLSNNCPMDHYYANTTLFSMGAYNPNSNCNFYVQNAFGGQITIIFGSIDTVKNKDIISIYDGGSTDDPLMGTVSGHYPAKKICYRSSGAWLTVNFNVHSTSVQGGGWTANVYHV